MTLHQPPDPSNSFYEEVLVGRNGNSNHDVRIIYTVYNRGRGEFSVTDGGEKIWDRPDETNRKLRVETKHGARFSITRRRGRGGLCLCLLHSSQSETNTIKLVSLRQFIFILKDTI